MVVAAAGADRAQDLRQAIFAGDLSIVQGAVKSRRGVDVPDSRGWTHLMNAVAYAKGPRVEMLRGDEYLRIWISKGGVNYLIHLPPA